MTSFLEFSRTLRQAMDPIGLLLLGVALVGMLCAGLVLWVRRKLELRRTPRERRLRIIRSLNEDR